MRNRSWLVIHLLMVLMLLLVGCSSPSPSPESTSSSDTPLASAEDAQASASNVNKIDPERPVVVTVGGVPAYVDDFENAKNSLLNQYAQTYAQFGMDLLTVLAGADGRMFELGIEAEAALQLIQLILTQDEANRRNITLNESDVRAEFDRQYGEFLSSRGWTEAELEQFLADQGLDLVTFRADVTRYIEHQLLAMAVQEAVAGAIDLTGDDVAAYFEEHKSEFAMTYTGPGDLDLSSVESDVRDALRESIARERAETWYEELYNATELVFSDPLLGAMVIQMTDLDEAIAVLEAERDAGSVEDAHLPFVLATFYEQKASTLDDGKVVEGDAEIIAAYREKALHAFREAQASLGNDPAIDSKILELEALLPSNSETAP